MHEKLNPNRYKEKRETLLTEFDFYIIVITFSYQISKAIKYRV